MYCYTLECRDLSTEEYAELKERLDSSFVACRTIAERILEFYDEESDEIKIRNTYGISRQCHLLRR